MKVSEASWTASRCPLLMLPNELLLSVAAQCQPVAIATIRCTGWRLHLLLTKSKLTELDLKAFQRLLKWDDYLHLCSQERQGLIGRDNTALCSHCLKAHRCDFFAPVELALRPERRVCRGSVATLSVCQHVDLQLREIRDSCKGFNGGMANACIHRDHQGLLGLDSGPYVRRSQRDGFTLSTGYIILRIRTGDSPEVDKVEMTLSSRRQRVCPHLRLSSPLISMAFHSQDKVTNTNEPWCNSVCSRLHSCPQAACKTTFHFTRQHHNYHGADFVLLKVNRALGLLEDPTDAAWLAQTEAVWR